MTKNQKLILGALGVGVGIYLATKTVGAAKLEFYFKTVDVSKLSFSNQKVDTIMTVVNPSGVKQTVNAIFANLYADGNHIGRIETNTPQIILPFQSNELRLPTILMPVGAGLLIADLVKGKKPKFTVEGIVNSMGVSIPFKQNLN